MYSFIFRDEKFSLALLQQERSKIKIESQMLNVTSAMNLSLDLKKNS
jgi:hypothetical protein